MNREDCTEGCPVFGVQNGGPAIGLGVLIILFGLVPLAVGGIPLPLPIALIFVGFGFFLIWAGLKQ